MKVFKERKSNALVLGALVGSLLNACAPKQNLGGDLANTQVFQNQGEATQGSSTAGSGSTGTSSGSKGTENSKFSLNSINMCSTNDVQSVGTSVVQASAGVTVRMFKISQAEGASSSSGSSSAMIYGIKPFGQSGADLGPEVKLPAQDPIAMRKDLINKKQLSVNLSGIDPGKYFALLMDTVKKVSISTLVQVEVKSNGTVVISSPISTSGLPGTSKLPFAVLYNYNPDQPPKSLAATGNGEGTPEPTPQPCDEKASPLMLDTAHDLAHARFDMSAPLEGIQFDIDGKGRKNQISWPLNPAQNAFLTLPENDQVNSVHQLFGNKTVGPDGLSAANGFEALRKYDLNKDSVIDNKDAIYDQLRLWYDLNRNGLSESDELKTLAEKNITSISLKYQEVSEEDAFKNETRQRSQVKAADDSARMIIDIWFRKVY